MQRRQKHTAPYGLLNWGFTVVLAVFLFGQSAAASTQCGVTGPVQILVEDMRQVLRLQGNITQTLATRVGDSAGAVSLARVSKRLETLGLSQRMSLLEDLLATAAEISVSKSIRNPALAQWHLRSVELLITQACLLDQRPVDSLPDRMTFLELLPDMFGSLDSPLPPTARETALRLSSLTIVLGITIALMYLTKTLYVWGYAFFYNRRACRINAVLEFGIDVVDVHITILGRNGCRIQPVNDGAFKRVESLVHIENPRIIIGRHQLPIRIDGVHGYFVSTYFETPLSSRLQKVLLGASALAPFHVKKSIPRSNVSATRNSGA